MSNSNILRTDEITLDGTVYLVTYEARGHCVYQPGTYNDPLESYVDDLDLTISAVVDENAVDHPTLHLRAKETLLNDSAVMERVEQDLFESFMDAGDYEDVGD